MRKKESPETPYCTIEICGNKILQWYQKYDKKPDAEIIQPWLDRYVKQIEKSKNIKKIKQKQLKQVM